MNDDSPKLEPMPRASFKKKATVFATAFAAMLAVSILWTVNRSGSISDPPVSRNVDGVFYDNIAFNLNRGEGFLVDLQAQPWRETYVKANQQQQSDLDYEWLLPVKGTGPTLLRSPAYPFALAKIFQVSNHRYDVARIFGCVFVSLGLAMFLTFSALRWGYLPAVVGGATLSLDFSVMQSAGIIATESLAILVFATTFLLVVKAWEKPTMGSWFIAGVGFSVLTLTRGIWSLGLLLLIVSAGVCFLPAIRNRWETLRWSHLAVFLVAAILFAMPWWARNCMTTGHFTPFGLAGSCGFVAGYCDESLANHGQWQPDVFNRNQIEVQQNVDMDTIRLADLEYMTGQESVRKTKAWCLANWKRIPELMLARGLSHWGFYNAEVPWIFQIGNVVLVAVGLLGCFIFTGSVRGIFIVVLLLDSLLVMLTWEHLGRYAIPIRPLVHLGYGLAISWLVRLFSKT